MTDLTNEQTIKLLRLQKALGDHLESTVPNKRVREHLLGELINTASGRAAVLGSYEADLEEVANAVQSTETGALVLRLWREHEASKDVAAVESDRDRLLREVNAIENRAERMSRARDAGLI